MAIATASRPHRVAGSSRSRTSPRSRRPRPSGRWSAGAAHRWSQRLRADDRPPPWWRPQRQYRLGRLPSRQGWRTGKVAAIGSDPNRDARVALAALPRRSRSASSSLRSASASATCSRAAEARTFAPATRSRCASCRVGTVVHDLELEPVARREGGPRGPLPAIQLVTRRACTPRCDFLSRSGSVASPSTAGPQSAPSATPSRSRSPWQGRSEPVEGHRPRPWVAINPVDHPLGGGGARPPVDRHPVSPWGKPRGPHSQEGQGVRPDDRSSSPQSRQPEVHAMPAQPRRRVHSSTSTFG